VVQILKQAAVVPDRAVIVVTHDTRIFRFAHNIARMEDGMIGSIRSAAHGELAEVA
jgi:putative ABC transport system ATP-binding protein